MRPSQDPPGGPSVASSPAPRSSFQGLSAGGTPRRAGPPHPAISCQALAALCHFAVTKRAAIRRRRALMRGREGRRRGAAGSARPRRATTAVISIGGKEISSEQSVNFSPHPSPHAHTHSNVRACGGLMKTFGLLQFVLRSVSCLSLLIKTCTCPHSSRGPLTRGCNSSPIGPILIINSDGSFKQVHPLRKSATISSWNCLRLLRNTLLCSAALWPHTAPAVHAAVNTRETGENIAHNIPPNATISEGL